MGCQLKYGTAGATGGGWSSQPGSIQAAMADRLPLLPVNDYQCRAPKTWRDRNKWHSLWSFGCRIGCGDANMDGAPGIGIGMTDIDLFEPYSCDGEGTQSRRFIRGTVKDSGGTAVAGALVQGFVTATDTYVGEVQSNLDGTYTLGTETLPGVPHYLVAYKPGSPDVAGTTVNTLTSTNVDGS